MNGNFSSIMTDKDGNVIMKSAGKNTLSNPLIQTSLLEVIDLWGRFSSKTKLGLKIGSLGIIYTNASDQKGLPNYNMPTLYLLDLPAEFDISTGRIPYLNIDGTLNKDIVKGYAPLSYDVSSNKIVGNLVQNTNELLDETGENVINILSNFNCVYRVVEFDATKEIAKYNHIMIAPGFGGLISNYGEFSGRLLSDSYDTDALSNLSMIPNNVSGLTNDSQILVMKNNVNGNYYKYDYTTGQYDLVDKLVISKNNNLAHGFNYDSIHGALIATNYNGDYKPYLLKYNAEVNGFDTIGSLSTTSFTTLGVIVVNDNIYMISDYIYKAVVSSDLTISGFEQITTSSFIKNIPGNEPFANIVGYIDGVYYVQTTKRILACTDLQNVSGTMTWFIWISNTSISQVKMLKVNNSIHMYLYRINRIVRQNNIDSCVYKILDKTDISGLIDINSFDSNFYALFKESADVVKEESSKLKIAYYISI